MQLKDYQKCWNTKPVLREIYHNLYQKIENNLLIGDTLEIGGGIGNLQLNEGRVVKTDIQYYSGVDVVADAQKLPFNNNTFSNIVLFDVLHHLQCPLLFFEEAVRVLKPGGRVIMMEPGITPVSKLLYKIGHVEPVEMGWNMEDLCQVDKDKDPYESNQAIPTIIFKRDVKIFLSLNKKFNIIRSDWLSLFAYPLSGGFQPWSLIPCSWIQIVLRLEEKLLPFLGNIMAFLLMVVLEKNES